VAILQRDGPGEQPGREVRDAERLDLARPHEPVERLERRLQRHAGIGRVHLVQVDLVDAEAAQARVAGGADAIGVEALPAGVGDREADLGREHHVVAVAGEPRREGLLREAVVVGVGGVEEVAARVEVAVEHPMRFLARGLRAHQHRAEAEAGDREGAELSGVHPP
jgi:hypothetical protein